MTCECQKIGISPLPKNITCHREFFIPIIILRLLRKTNTKKKISLIIIIIMFLKKISFVLLAVLVGVAMAWIRPAQPKQVEQPVVPNFVAKKTTQLLDNEDIPLENGIHNSRKCKFNPLSKELGSFE